MNKLIRKVVGVTLGLAMALGVGVAIGTRPVDVRSASAATSDVTAAVNIADYATEHGWTDSGGGPYKSVQIDSHISATLSTTGGNSGKYYSDWRLYQSESEIITISTNSGTLSSITYTYTNSNTGVLATVSGQSVAVANRVNSDTAKTVSGSSYSLYVANTSEKTNGQVRITAISVTYTVPVSTFSVTYNNNQTYMTAQGAGTISGSVPTDSSSYGSGASVTVLGNTGNLALANHSFNGWNTEPDGSGTSRAVGSTFAISANTTLYAQWLDTRQYYDITTSSNHLNLSGDTHVLQGEPAEVIVSADAKWLIPDAITVNGESSSSNWDYENGVLTILEVTENMVVAGTATAASIDSISVTVDSSEQSFYLGHDFTHSTAVVTATYNDDQATQEDVTSGCTWSNPDMRSTGSKTVTVTHTASGKTASYQISVSVVVPSAGGPRKITNASELTINSTVYLVCESASKQLSGISTANTKYGEGADYTTTPSSTVYPLTVEAGYSSGTYSFKNGNNYLCWTSGNSLNVSTTKGDDNKTSWTVTFNSSGNALLANKNDSAREIWWNTSSPRFACYTDKTEESTGYAPIQLYKNYPAVVAELKWITAEVKSGTYYQGSSVTSSDFTVTAHYDDGTTSTPTTGITVTNGELNNIGENVVTLTYGGKSCTVSVNAIEQTATLTGLAWAQGEYDVVDNHGIDFSELGVVTAEYDDGDSYATKSINQCSVAAYTKNGNEYSKVTDLDNGDTIASSLNGKYLGISYTEGEVTEYAYSSAAICVVEEINDVYVQVETISWNKITSVSVGDKVTFANEENSRVASAKGSNIINVATYEETISNPYELVVGSDGNGNYTLHNATDGYLKYNVRAASSLNNIYFSDEVDTDEFTTSWSIYFDDSNNAVIKSIYTIGDGDTNTDRTIRYNSANPRFACYTSGQQDIQLYKEIKGYTPEGSNFANTNATAQKVVLEYATHFIETMACQSDGSTANVSSKWTDLADDFDNWFNNGDRDLTEAQVEHAFALFANAYAVEGGDILQDMLAKYEYICAKYSLDDFLHDQTERPEVHPSSARIGIFGNINSESSTAIIVIVSLVSLTAIGGYFFLKKRKEQQ